MVRNVQVHNMLLGFVKVTHNHELRVFMLSNLEIVDTA